MTIRTYYIDRVRVVLTALVILHHTAITYGAPGGWFYNELHPSAAPSSELLTVFVAVNQAFFMGFFFLLAGYFTPGSYERKGWRRFLLERLVRLGIPLVFFALVLAPITIAIARGVSLRQMPAFWLTLMHRGVIVEGPLWFAQALLLFSVGYCLWRAWHGPLAKQPGLPLPSGRSWLLSALAVAAVALVIRHWVPVGVNILEMQLGYFASYIFLFAVGCAAWRGDWLDRLGRSRARRWGIIALCVIPLLPLTILLTAHAGGPNNSYGGGFNFHAALYAFWEPFVAWGIIAWMIYWFREHANRPSPVWKALGRQAYAVYIIHPPVLVAAALLFHRWQAPALLKFAVTGSLTCVACSLLALLLVRIPGIARVV
jgi:fucose 4-O-acetylase-like acetyltransferase